MKNCSMTTTYMHSETWDMSRCVLNLMLGGSHCTIFWVVGLPRSSLTPRWCPGIERNVGRRDKKELAAESHHWWLSFYLGALCFIFSLLVCTQCGAPGAVLQDISWPCLGNCIQCLGLNSGRMHARQAFYH